MKITDIPQDLEPRVGDIIEIEQGEDCFEVRIIGITADGYLCEQDNIQGAVLLEGTALDHQDVADIMPLVEGLRDPKDNPCWKGYHPVGTKQKNGRTVPNCVPNAKESVEEAGPFSYGAKKPRRGSVAYNAMMKRREQEKNRPPIEPKDQMVGTAKLTKDVSETSDYFRRREREEAIISGQKPARKKQPAQTSDYARRREQEKKKVKEAWDSNKSAGLQNLMKGIGDSFQEGAMEKAIVYYLQGRHQEGANFLRTAFKSVAPEVANKIKAQLEKLPKVNVDPNSDAKTQKYIKDQVIPWIKSQLNAAPQSSTPTTQTTNYSVGISDEEAAKKIADKLQGMPVNSSNIQNYVKKYLNMVGRTEKDLAQLSTLVLDKLNNQGVAEGSLNEYALGNGGDEGNDDSLFIYAKMWYNGNLQTQRQVEKALHKAGFDIGENEDENGGVFITGPGDYYESWTAEDLEQGVAEGGLQYHTGVKKHGEEYMRKAAEAGRKGASQEELGRLRDRYSKAYKKDVKEEQLDEYSFADKKTYMKFLAAKVQKYGVQALKPEERAELIAYLQAQKMTQESGQEEHEYSLSLGSGRRPGHGWDQDSTSRADRMQAQDDELKQSHIEHVLKKYPKLKRSDLESKSLTELIRMLRGDMNEAEYQGRKVALGKPMAGDVKKSKVYVRKPNGKVVKVNFGDKDMKIKKSNPKRRKSFRARHNCENPGPRWKARYWSCRAW